MGEVGINSRLSEMALLGAMLKDVRVYERIVDKPVDRWMYYDNHAIIYRILVEMYTRGIAIDLVTAVSYIESHELVLKLTGSFRVDLVGSLVECIDSCPTSETVEYYIETIRSYYARRRMYRGGVRISELMKSVNDPMVGIDEVCDMIEQEVASIRNDTGIVTSESELVYYRHEDIVEIDEVGDGIVVEDWIDRGTVSMIAGRPKTGKSWLGLGMAIAVACGGSWLGYPTVKGSVIYLALEDNEVRLKNRLEMLSLGSVYDNLVLVTKIKRTALGGITQLMRLIDQVGDVSLVVIDTYQMFRSDISRNSMIYQEDYKSISEIKELAKMTKVAVVLIHHLRKYQMMETDDIVERILGSTGIIGALDTIMVLDKPRMSNIGNLLRTGRDVGEMMFAVEFRPEDGTWKMLGSTEKYMNERTRDAIVDVFKKSKVDILSIYEIAEMTGIQRATVRKALSRMSDEGLIVRIDRGKYMLHRGEV